MELQFGKLSEPQGHNYVNKELASPVPSLFLPWSQAVMLVKVVHTMVL